MKTNRQSPRASRISRVLPRMGLALVLFALVCVGLSRKTEATIGFCVTDDGTHNNITFTTGGAYTFTQCSPALTVTGTGVVKNNSGVMTLTDKKPDRSVSAGFNTGQGTGSAAIYFTPTPGGAAQVFRVNQTIPYAPCGCGGGLPPK